MFQILIVKIELHIDFPLLTTTELAFIINARNKLVFDQRMNMSYVKTRGALDDTEEYAYLELKFA